MSLSSTTFHNYDSFGVCHRIIINKVNTKIDQETNNIYKFLCEIQCATLYNIYNLIEFELIEYYLN